MRKAISIIRDEHRSIAAVLHGMEFLVNEIKARKADIDARVFRAMLYYLDTFAERLHHPKEDQYLFEPMRRRGTQANALIEELEREHASGERSLQHLEQHLVRYEEGGEREFPEFYAAVVQFVAGYREHIRKEEEEMFPLAERMLTDADWEAAAAPFGENRDPLVGGPAAKDFDRLFERIVSLAPPPIGLGAASPGKH
jgi:hemerythrin-like domain-containing protein